MSERSVCKRARVSFVVEMSKTSSTFDDDDEAFTAVLFDFYFYSRITVVVVVIGTDERNHPTCRSTITLSSSQIPFRFVLLLSNSSPSRHVLQRHRPNEDENEEEEEEEEEGHSSLVF